VWKRRNERACSITPSLNLSDERRKKKKENYNAALVRDRTSEKRASLSDSSFQSLCRKYGTGEGKGRKIGGSSPCAGGERREREAGWVFPPPAADARRKKKKKKDIQGPVTGHGRRKGACVGKASKSLLSEPQKKGKKKKKGRPGGAGLSLKRARKKVKVFVGDGDFFLPFVPIVSAGEKKGKDARCQSPASL